MSTKTIGARIAREWSNKHHGHLMWQPGIPDLAAAIDAEIDAKSTRAFSMGRDDGEARMRQRVEQAEREREEAREVLGSLIDTHKATEARLALLTEAVTAHRAVVDAWNDFVTFKSTERPTVEPAGAWAAVCAALDEEGKSEDQLFAERAQRVLGEPAPQAAAVLRVAADPFAAESAVETAEPAPADDKALAYDMAHKTQYMPRHEQVAYFRERLATIRREIAERKLTGTDTADLIAAVRREERERVDDHARHIGRMVEQYEQRGDEPMGDYLRSTLKDIRDTAAAIRARDEGGRGDAD